MSTLECNPLFQRISRLEMPLCLALNRINHHPFGSHLFGAISHLGDGWFWYGIMILLPIVHGSEAVSAVLHMILVGLACLLIYKLIKESTARIRPFELDDAFHKSVPPLDRYSFPSGHTLHAVGFTIPLLYHYPAWGWVAIPFILLVALSRVVLALHFPSDVLAGALIGAVIATLSLLLV